MDKFTRPLWFPILLLMLTIGSPLSPGAQEITIIPSFSASGEYNDNVLFERSGELDDFIYNLTPGIGLDYATESLTINSNALLNFRRYTSESFLDREDQYFNLRTLYRLTERLDFRGRFYYLKDSTNESRLIDLDETAPDVIEVVDPGIERFLSERKRYDGWAALNYQLTELSTLDGRYRYRKNTYDFEGNTDNEINEFDLTFLRRLEGQRDRIGAEISYFQNSSDVSDADTYAFSLIWNHYFTEIWNVYAKAGVRYTEQDFSGRNDSETTWAGIANIRLLRIGENNRFSIGFRQNLQTASDGRSVNVSRLYWDSRLDLTERLFLNVEGDFYITREEGDSTVDEDTVYFDVIPSLEYLLTENFSVSLAYSYTVEYDRTLDTDEDIQRNRVWVFFEFVFPKYL